MFESVSPSENINDNNPNTTSRSPIRFENISIFPKVGTLPGSEKMRYVGHYGSTIHKILYLTTKTYTNHLLSVGDDRRITIWNVQTNSCCKIITVDYLIYDVVYTEDDNVIVCGEQIQKLNLENETVVYTIKSPIGHFKEYSAVAKMNNDTIVAVSMNNKYLVFDNKSGKVVKEISLNREHYVCKVENKKDNESMSVPYANEGKEEDDISENEEKDEIAELANDMTIKKTDTKKSKDTPTLDLKGSTPNNNNINTSNKSPPGLKDSTAEQTNKEEGEGKVKYHHHQKRKIKLRNIGSAECSHTNIQHKYYVYHIIPMHTKEYPNSIITGGFDNIVKITKLQTEEVSDFIGHENNISALCLLSKQYLLSGSYDWTIRKWNLLSKQCDDVYEEHKAIISVLLPLSNGRFMSAAMDKSIKVWNDEGKCEKTFTYKNAVLKTACSCGVGSNMYGYGDAKGEIFIKKFIDS